jgi:hypothetical protein
MDWNPYSDLSWGAQICYHWNYFSPYDRYIWISDCVSYDISGRWNSWNSIALKEMKSNNTFWITAMAE